MKVGDVVRFVYDPDLKHAAKYSEMLLKSTSGERGTILAIEYDNKRETYKFKFRSFYGATLEANETELELLESAPERVDRKKSDKKETIKEAVGLLFSDRVN